jgi:GNAT superfamily N-acetyltransferase
LTGVPSDNGYVGVSVRRATAEDVPALSDIYRRSSLSNVADRAGLLASPHLMEWAGDGVTAGRTQVAVETGGRLLGFATVVPLGDGLELEDLFVDPDFMRRGVATQLMSVVVEQAGIAGTPWMEVTGNPHAAEFYASVGFVVVGRVQTTLGDAPRLRLQLSPTGDSHVDTDRRLSHRGTEAR